jgi:hypothetical protein
MGPIAAAMAIASSSSEPYSICRRKYVRDEESWSSRFDVMYMWAVLSSDPQLHKLHGERVIYPRHYARGFQLLQFLMAT